MILSNDEVDMLDDFYANDIDDGALSFDFPKPRDNTTTITVKLVAPPGIRSSGPVNFAVSLRFIQLP